MRATRCSAASWRGSRRASHSLPEAGASPASLTCALDLGVLLAAVSVTSPHTIHPHADLPALVDLAGRTGRTFGPPLADVL